MVDSKQILQSLREQLHVGVDGAWARPEMLAAKDALSAIARSAIEECYEACANQTTNIRECYRRCAERAGLGPAYRKEWGKEGGPAARPLIREVT